MTIRLRIDKDGRPYLELLAQDHDPNADCQVLRVFIRRAREKGLHIKNESALESCDEYATIRLGPG
jgi:ribosomal 50S subunit-associated protein YjgA (DUF615 family)